MLKESGEDFEWYPTTNEMISVVFRSCGNISSVLDIGAGDGRVLVMLEKLLKKNVKKYAIEISQVHIENMPPDISIVGTDFRRQTLIDKKVDVVFCNPPYSEYEEWAAQIIKEANAKKIYLIIPKRWTNSALIKQAIKQREAKEKVLWSGDFADAERQARGAVDIVRIVLTDEDRYREQEKTDPFTVWFNEYFSGFERLNPAGDDEEKEVGDPGPLHEMVEGQNLVERLSLLYRNEMNVLLGNYKTLSELDASLLKEIGVSVDEIRKALKLKIEGLKNRYWQELFDRLDAITNKLTTKSRRAILEKLHASCNIDFSVDNAYAVVIWAIKNANKYLDQQVCEVFKKLSEPECVKNYKSNINTWEKDRWRYKQQEHTHYMLEYRIISNQWTAVVKDGSWDAQNGLYSDYNSFINDIFTIANNLGFGNIGNSLHKRWESGLENEFYYGDGKTLVKIRAYLNGNIHLRFDQDFIKTLNVEASRLLGWIRSPQEAADEMGLDIDFVKSKFKSNLLFGLSEGRKLLCAG